MVTKNDFDVKGAIQEIADANDGVKFDQKIQASIQRSVDLQKDIKKLIWTTIKDKFLWFFIALVVLLGTNFVIGWAQELGKQLAQ